MALGLALATAAPSVVMKVLVLDGSTSETSYKSITAYLKQIGVPYQAVTLSNIAADSSGNRLSSIPLSDSTTGRGLYQGIILTDSTFAACGSSCLSSADWTTLNTYAAQYGVRVASYYTLPQAQWGLLPADSGSSYKAAAPLNVTLTAAGAAVFSYLNSANAIPVSGQGSTGINAYLATTTAAANETTTALMTAGAYTVAATHTTADGRETLALTMDNSAKLLHSLAFGYGVINWVTKGVFLGSRKVYLNPQIDDMLLGNRLYAPTLPQCPDDESCPTILASAQDIQALLNWQNSVKADPLFSTFHNTYAFNGIGSTWYPPNDPIFSAISTLGPNFTWLNHTWDHNALDCYSTDANGNCVPATLAQSQAELNQDIAIAPSLGINLDRTSMVTPFNGGLGNSAFLTAAVQAGLQYIVTALPPASVSTGVVNPLNSAIYEIPRVTPNLFDDVSVPQSGAYGSWTDEYNATFGPGGTQPTYSQAQTYAQILDNESSNILLGTMLTYEPYLLAYHIDNSSAYDGTHSLFSDLTDAMIAKYKKLFTLPVLTMDMKDLAPVLMNRASYNASGVTGVYTPGVGVTLTTTNAATIPVTGACSQTSCGTYGGQVQDSVAMAAGGTVTLTLAPAASVSLSSVSIAPTSVTSGGTATGTVTLSGSAPTGGVSISLTSNNASATAPASVTVGAGSATATFTITTSAVTSGTSVTITATYSGASQTASLAITPAAAVTVSAVSVNPTTVAGGTPATGTVTLSGAAPTGGLTVQLWTNGSPAFVPSSITIAAGATTGAFAVTTTNVSTATAGTITAFYNGASQNTTITVTPGATATVSSVSVNPNSVAGGTSTTGTVTLSGAAPTGGLTVQLWTNGSPAFVPSSITIAAGATTGSFAVTTTAVSTATQGTITVYYSGIMQTTTVTVTPSTAAAATVSAVSVSPTSVTGGATTTGTVTLTAAAPTGGLVLQLWTNGSPAFVPASITIAAGSTTGTFTVTTTSVSVATQGTITAFYNGVSWTTTVTVTP